MPCLSSSVLSTLKESIRVSNALSQLAVPLTIRTFLDSSVMDSPKGSAVWTLAAGGCAAGGDGGAGVALAAGAGLAGAAGAGLAEGAGAGLADAAGAGVD